MDGMYMRGAFERHVEGQQAALAQFPQARVFWFGSFIYGGATLASDIDLAISDLTADDIHHARELCDIGPLPIDVLRLEGLPPLERARIAANGKRLA